jgi:hypothetical protein
MIQSRRIILIFALFIFTVISPRAIAQEYGVFEYIVEKAEGSADDVAAAIVQAATTSGISVLAEINAGVPEGCTYKAKVVILLDSSYAAQIMEANSNTGPFAVIDRINVFEDEAGTHVSIVNPHSINRTVLMDDKKYEEMSENHLKNVRALVTGAVKGTVSTKQYGQIRDEGYISKTMGVMAGGLFEEKIDNLITVPKANLAEVAAKVKNSLSTPGPEWGLHQVYEINFPQKNTIVFGVTGAAMEAKSFDIVEEGGDDSRDDYDYPGLAHAGSYPFQIALVQNGDNVDIRLVTAMFRMKIFFEDAGKWAFMKNMGMPGSLADEVEDSLNKGLGLN